MTFIEGVGDEVTAFAVVLLVLVLAATITFLLNSTPFSDRRVTQATNAPSSSLQSSAVHRQNQEQQSNNENSNSIISNLSSNSTNNHEVHNVVGEVHNTIEEVHHVLGEEEVVPAETNCTEASVEETVNSGIYPDIPDSDSISGHFSEEAVEENEERPPDPAQIHIRLKYLDDTERCVASQPSVTIDDFKRTHFAEDFANNKAVRLIFSGQRLQDNATLQSYGVTNNCVVHVQVIEAQVPNSTVPSQNTDLDLSHLLWPLLSVILGICWLLYFKYPEFFNLMSVGILFLFTGSLFAYCYSQIQVQ